MSNPQPPGGSGNRMRYWQIATAVLAVTTVIGLVWGFMATKNANDQNAANQAQIEQLQAQMTAEEGSAAKHLQADAERIRHYEGSVKELKGNLKVDTKNLTAEAEKITQLRNTYDQEKAAAAAEDASLQSQLNAANSKVALAEHCAAVMASGLTKIYEDVPTIVTYKEVASVMNTAAANCQGIVNVATP